MMYKKAVCFGDKDMANKILATDDVAEIKAFGRLVANYNESYWNGVRQIVVFEGLTAKFSQNEDLKAKLKAYTITQFWQSVQLRTEYGA